MAVRATSPASMSSAVRHDAPSPTARTLANPSTSTTQPPTPSPPPSLCSSGCMVAAGVRAARPTCPPPSWRCVRRALRSPPSATASRKDVQRPIYSLPGAVGRRRRRGELAAHQSQRDLAPADPSRFIAAGSPRAATSRRCSPFTTVATLQRPFGASSRLAPLRSSRRYSCDREHLCLGRARPLATRSILLQCRRPARRYTMHGRPPPWLLRPRELHAIDH